LGVPLLGALDLLVLHPIAAAGVNRWMDCVIGPISGWAARHGAGPGFGQKGAKSAKKMLPRGCPAIIITTLVKQTNGYHSYQCR